MRRLSVLAASLLLTAMAVAACDVTITGFGVRGSGDMASETREVSGFDEVVLRGSGRVMVDVTGAESLTIDAEDNILPLLESKVSNGRLELGARESISPTEEIVYTITASELRGVTISGSGDVRVSEFTTDSFTVEVNGSGDVDVSRIEADEVNVDISGSGGVEISGSSNLLEIGISGSGRFDGPDLEAAIGSVRISGSGDAVINVSDTLNATVSGSGNVEYIGSPTLNASTSGSGDISSR